jgi:hypothetical protein
MFPHPSLCGSWVRSVELAKIHFVDQGWKLISNPATQSPLCSGTDGKEEKKETYAARPSSVSRALFVETPATKWRYADRFRQLGLVTVASFRNPLAQIDNGYREDISSCRKKRRGDFLEPERFELDRTVASESCYRYMRTKASGKSPSLDVYRDVAHHIVVTRT